MERRVRQFFLVFLLLGAGASAQPSAIGGNAPEPLAEPLRLLVEGRPMEARAGISSARERYAASEDALGVAQCDFLEAMAVRGEGHEAAAVTRLEASQVALARAGDPLSAALAAWMLIESYKGEGELEAAERSARLALEALAEAGRRPESMQLDGFLRMGKLFGAPVEDVYTTGPMVAFIKPMLVALLEGPLRDALAGALIDQGRLSEAEVELEKAQTTSRMLGGLFDSSIEIHRGDIYRRQWKLAEAKESYEKGLTTILSIPILGKPRDSRQRLQVMGELATIEQLAGHPEKALEWNEKALSLAREDSDCRHEARALEARGDLLAQQGRSAESLVAYREALSLSTSVGNLLRQASILSSIGSQALFHGDYEDAVADLERARVLYLEAGEPRLASMVSLSLAQGYLLMGAPGNSSQVIADESNEAFPSLAAAFESLRSLQESISDLELGKGSPEAVQKQLDELARTDGTDFGIEPQLWSDLIVGLRKIFDVSRQHDPPASAAAMEVLCQVEDRLGIPLCSLLPLQQGRIAWSRGDVEATIVEWRKALVRAKAGGQKDFAAGIGAALGAAYLRQGNLEAAETQLREAAAGLDLTLSSIHVDALLTSFLGSGRNLYHELLVEVLARRGKWREAFEASEAARSRALAFSLGNPRLRPRDSGDRELLAREEGVRGTLRVWEQSLATLSGSERQAREQDLANGRRDLESLLARLRVAHPEYASLVHADSVTVDQVQRSLDEQTTLVSYFVNPRSAYAWVIDRENFTGLVLPLSAAELSELSCFAREQRTPSVRRGVEVVDAQPCSPGEDRSRKLYRQLIAPLRPYLHHVRLTLLPYGPLNGLPFAALRNPETGLYLIEERTLTYAPSASVLGFLHQKESSFDGKVLILGSPLPADPQLPPLSGARGEAEAVAKLFGSTPLLGAAASESHLRERSKDIDLLHIAAHSYYDPRNPGFSRLALTPDERNDGYLEVQEIYSDLDLSGVDLVVLSACETGIGTRSGGDEILGLTRAFLYAGSPAVVSTLWRIDDLAASRLMESFYRRLLSGEAAADALRQAQLSLLHDPATADPSYWAAFLVVGDPKTSWAGAGSPTSSVAACLRRGFIATGSSAKSRSQFKEVQE